MIGSSIKIEKSDSKIIQLILEFNIHTLKLKMRFNWMHNYDWLTEILIFLKYNI